MSIAQITGPGHEPSEALHKAVRVRFIEQDTSLSEWCRLHGVTRQYADKCLKGLRDGPNARALRARIAVAAGVSGNAPR